jgi:hypothetical protein
VIIKPTIEWPVREVDKFAKETAEKIGEAGDEGGKKLEAALSDRLKKMSLDDALGAFGKAKDIFDKTAVSLFGMNEEMAKSISDGADLAIKGAELGKTFGIWGAVIGGAAGALAQLAIELKKARAESEAFMGSVLGVGFMAKVAKAKVGVGQEAAAGVLGAFAGALKGVAATAGDYGKALSTIEGATKKAGGAARDAAADFAELNRQLGEAIRKNAALGIAAAGATNQGRQGERDLQLGALSGQNQGAQILGGFHDASFKQAQAVFEFTGRADTALETLRKSAGETALSILGSLGGSFASIAKSAGEASAQGVKGFKAWTQAAKAEAPAIKEALSGELIGLGFKLGAKSAEAFAAGRIPAGLLLAAGSATAFAGAARLGFAAGQAGAQAAAGGGGGAASSAGFSQSRDPGPTNLSTVNVTFQSTVPMTFDQQVEAARTIQGLLAVGAQGGPQLQGGR